MKVKTFTRDVGGKNGYHAALINLDLQVNQFGESHRIITVLQDVLLQSPYYENGKPVLARTITYDDEYTENS